MNEIDEQSAIKRKKKKKKKRKRRKERKKERKKKRVVDAHESRARFFRQYGPALSKPA